MARLRIAVTSGTAAGAAIEPVSDVVRVGRARTNDLVLAEHHVSSEHARFVISDDAVVLEDLASTNGTAVLRSGERLIVTADAPRTLESGDVVELGGEGEASTTLAITLGDEPEPANVVATKPLSELGTGTADGQTDAQLLRALHPLQKAIGAARDLDDVLLAVADAALAMVPGATHVTLILRDETADENAPAASAYVPVMTRVRGAGGAGFTPEDAVPVTRSVFRKVVRERAAVLAADAADEDLDSESLLGTGIRSTIGVPLWRDEEILGVLQVDNRDAPAMFSARDLDVLGVLASNASLAVANARLIRKLKTAEERLERENTFLKSRARGQSGGDVEMIGESKAITSLVDQLGKVVDTRVSVLIEGETGTGKELIASILHYRSKRRERLLVTQNCAALPETLLESELFGHKRGAFTGATEEKKGLFEIADGGTLFLDEVGEMPMGLQAKLLRVLQEGEVRPLGTTTPKHVDVRVVAATNRNLEQEVADGNFREDLYYRIKVFPIRVPPLRERRSDIPLLANFFLERYSREFGKPVAGLAQETIEILSAYEWPGNVRELENELQRLVIQADPEGFITADLLSPRVRKIEATVSKAGVTKGTLKEMVEQVEKYFLLEALREHNNNKTSAAKALGITREGLHKKLRQLKIG